MFPLREKIKTEARETEPNIVIANLWEIQNVPGTRWVILTCFSSINLHNNRSARWYHEPYFAKGFLVPIK